MDLNLIENIFNFILIFVFTGFIIYSILKKHLFSIFDFWIYIIVSETIILTLFTFLFSIGSISLDIYIEIILSTFFFILGLNTFYKKNLVYNFNKEILFSKTLKIFSYVVVSLYVINTSISIYLLGFPLLTDVRRTISAYSELGSGFGIIYYLDWGLKLILTLCIAFLYKKRKFKLSITILCIYVICLILNSGSRLVYLNLFLFFIYAMYLSNQQNINFKSVPKIIKYGLYFLPFVVIFSFSSAVKEGYESTAILAFFKRLIATAEGPFYYYVGRSSQIIPEINFFKYHFAQILPYFGVDTENEINLGVNITKYSTFAFGTKGFGPNPTFYVVGNLLFGKLSFIYSYLVGFFLSFLRYKLINFRFSTYFILNITGYSLIVDGTLFSMSLFYILIILIPLSIILIQGISKNDINNYCNSQ